MYTSNMEVVLSNHGVEVVPSPPPRPASAWRSPRSRPQSARPSGRPGSARARSPPVGFDDSPFIPSKEEPSAWEAKKGPNSNSVTTLIRAPLPPRPASAVPRRSPHKGPITDQLEAQLSKTARVLSVANEQLAEERRRVLLARRAEAQALAAAALSHQDAERYRQRLAGNAERERQKLEGQLAHRLEQDRVRLEEKMRGEERRRAEEQRQMAGLIAQVRRRPARQPPAAHPD
jgi:hypothetical protein